MWVFFLITFCCCFWKKWKKIFNRRKKFNFKERFSSLFLSLFSFWVITTRWELFLFSNEEILLSLFLCVPVEVVSFYLMWTMMTMMFTSARNKTFVFCLRVVSISSLKKKEITTKERSAARRTQSHEWIDTHRWYHSSLWSSSRLRKRSYLITRPSLRFLRWCVRRISRLSRRRWRSLYVVETYSTNCLLWRVRSRQSNQ